MDDDMEKDDMQDEVVDGNQTILSDGIFLTPPKLTPTGKVSHAKTRVYTQRYRKEWEQMPDFKGWLTAVPSQQTRAFCIYCKKNLHAHRLSLLKHTCTMKHQRAALLAQTDHGKRSENDESREESGDFTEVTVVGSLKGLEPEDEETEEFEYVVESLEIEEEEEGGDVIHDTAESQQMTLSHEEEIEDSDLKSLPEEDQTAKKIKLEPFPRRDALAEAMVHVHDDYLEQHEHEGTVGLDMEVESETTILPDNEDEDDHEENTRTTHEVPEVEPTPPCETSEKPKIITYQINSAGGVNSIGGINLGTNTVTIATNNSHPKTLTINSGKTVTLNTSKVAGGTQYVLSKVKGNLPTLVMAGTKPGNYRALAPKRGNKSLPMKRKVLTIPGTSGSMTQESSKQQETQKPTEVRNPCISTHVVDTSKGIPVVGLQVSLYKLMDGRWTFLNESTTSGSGRCTDLVDTGETAFTAGRYKMHFDVDKYFTIRRIETLYPFIEIVFDVKNPTGNYHIPVLLSPFGYSTYRGNDR